jgi:hypothetical protein
MFEMIGLLIGTAILFVLSLIAGLIYAGIAFLILWKRPRGRIPLLVLAAAIPVCSTAYMWLCVAVLPGESLFGDISQPLPNGYTLQALGKMPDFATIHQGDSNFGPLLVSQYIGRVNVEGPLIVGQYSHPFDAFDGDGHEPFFTFDTRTAAHVDYPTQSALEATVGHALTFSPVQSFRSHESSYVRQQRLHRIVFFLPPAFVSVMFFVILISIRRLQEPCLASQVR